MVGSCFELDIELRRIRNSISRYEFVLVSGFELVGGFYKLE